MTLSRRSWLSFAFLATVLALYIYGVISASQIPAEVVAVALPLDFIVALPLAFYLIVLRPKKMTPLTILPVIWLGYGLSAFALGSLAAGILPVLLAALFPVEVAIAVWEILHLACLFKGAKMQSADPLEWFYTVNVWVVMHDPVEVQTLLGTKRLLAIGLSLDDPQKFIQEVSQAANGLYRGES